MMSEMSTTDNRINNVTMLTEICTDTKLVSEDTPSLSQHNDSEQCKNNMNIPMDSNSINYGVENNNATVNSSTNYYSSVARELSSGISDLQVTKVLKFRLSVTVLVIVCSVIMLYQIPVILYYTDTPGEDSDSGGYDYETCSVSSTLVRIIAMP